MTKHLIAKVATVAMIFAACLLGTSSAFAQPRAIRGTVVDAGNVPVVGAAIVVPGTSNGVTTDLNGNFEIRVAPGTTLEVSCIGYETKRVAAADNLRVVLDDDAELLEETVVIGYGVQKKSDLTGAVASVRSEDLQNRSTTDAAAALQGKAAGVQIINTSGRPGAGAQIRVRGYSSNAGNIGPLLIVDGLKVDNIQYLDPSMIESMEVLKDAASAAIYGAEAGNGVVLITTKAGKDGHSSITYDLKMTNQSLGKKAELLNAFDYIDMQKYIGILNDKTIADNMWDGQDHNWYDATFAPSWSQQHGITFQGGNKNGHFLAALNYLNNDGIVRGKEDVYTRLTAQINADYQIKKWLQVGTNTSIEKYDTKSVSEAGYGAALTSVIALDPLTPAYYKSITECPAALHAKFLENPDLVRRDPENNNYFYGTSRFVTEATGNPLLQRSRSDNTNTGINIRGTLYANFTPFKGFTFTSRFGYRITQNSTHSFSTPYWATGMAHDENYTISAAVNTSYYYQWENFANYDRTFGKHTIGIMAGMSYIENNWDNLSGRVQQNEMPLRSLEPNFRYMDYLLASATKSISNAPGRSSSISYFGRLMYSYDDRYSIQANFRADAFDSSKLSERYRWGFFPSVSAGWTVSNENFIKDNISRDILSFLKIRASWGRNGNVNILNGYPYLASISLNSQWYQYEPGTGVQTYGSGPTGIANPDLHWETSEQWDAGIDLRMFNNRLTFGFDWYRKMTRDLLVNTTPRPEIGVKNSYQNAGNVLNTGLEFELGWKDVVGDFRYSINANFSTLHNEVTDLHFTVPRIEEDPVSGTNEKVTSAFEIGHPIWYFRGYKFIGANPETGAPRYYNAAGEVIEGTPEDGDRVYDIGKAIPDATYGLTINLAWKNFDFVLYGTGTIGNQIFNLMYSADRPAQNSLSYFWKNSWKPDNTGAYLADMYAVSANWQYWSSSACVFDGSFFKIKQIQLGYTLPQNLTKKIAISNLRLYVSLDDFFTFSSYPGADPETATTSRAQAMGFDVGSYPTMKKIVFGLNLTF